MTRKKSNVQTDDLKDSVGKYDVKSHNDFQHYTEDIPHLVFKTQARNSSGT